MAPVKILILLDGDSFHGESLWAEELPNRQYRLLNIPFFAYGYAENDIVQCAQDERRVTGIAHDSGNGTIRLVFWNTSGPAAVEVLQELASIGCTYEMGGDSLVAVNVPPNLQVPFSQLANYLNGLDKTILEAWEIGKSFTRSRGT